MHEIAPLVVHEHDRPAEGWVTASGGRLTWRTLVSADRDPTRAITAGITEIPPSDDPVTLHRHAADELYFVVSGAGVVVIDGTEHPVHAGSTAFIPGNRWHAVRNPGPDALRLFYAFPVDSFSDVVYEFPEGSTPPTWN